MTPKCWEPLSNRVLTSVIPVPYLNLSRPLLPFSFPQNPATLALRSLASSLVPQLLSWSACSLSPLPLPQHALSWPSSVYWPGLISCSLSLLWTPPEASGCTLLNHTEECSCPHFHPVVNILGLREHSSFPPWNVLAWSVFRETHISAIGTLGFWCVEVSRLSAGKTHWILLMPLRFSAFVPIPCLIFAGIWRAGSRQRERPPEDGGLY